MPINLASFIQPRNGNTFYLLEDAFQLGGFQVVESSAKRDSIQSLNRKHGMLVCTKDDGKIWILQADLVTWTEFSMQAGSRRRHVVVHQTDVLAPAESETFEVSMGATCTLVRLEVDATCYVEAHSTPERFDTNPYTFVAIPNLLVDLQVYVDPEGRLVKHDDGYFLANHESPVNDVIYWRILNLGNESRSITAILTYLTLENKP